MSFSLARGGTHQPAKPNMIGHVVLGFAALMFFSLSASAVLSTPALAEDVKSSASDSKGDERIDFDHVAALVDAEDRRPRVRTADQPERIGGGDSTPDREQQRGDEHDRQPATVSSGPPRRGR